MKLVPIHNINIYLEELGSYNELPCRFLMNQWNPNGRFPGMVD
jgi:hypothetical protein